MQRSIRTTVLLAGAMTLTLMAGAQKSAPPAHRAQPLTVDAAITYSAEYAKIAQNSCSCFWLQGVGADASLNFYRGLGLAVDFSQGAASNIQPSVNLSKINIAAGPRYSWTLGEWSKGAQPGEHTARMFAQSLFGMAHGYNSLFPTSTGTTATANSSLIEIGGAVDLGLGHNLSLRAVQATWSRTTLPNSSTNLQNDLRLGIGLSYRWKRK